MLAIVVCHVRSIVATQSDAPVGDKPLGGFNRCAHSAGPGVEDSKAGMDGGEVGGQVVDGIEEVG